MAGRMGIEPTTSCVTGRRSNQLNYRPVISKLPEGQQERSCTPDGTHDASSQWASRRWRPASVLNRGIRGLPEQLRLLYRTHKQKTSLRRPLPHVDSDVRRQDAECRAASRLADGYRMRMCACRRNRYRVSVRSGRGYREAMGVFTRPRG